ncbi:Ced DNA import system-associated protein CedA2 [Sulfurisphaera tokodaii]|nr:Ced DNA import system associated protein CedA2 [Sulfurisphaera tokodaii]HII74913.1 hypothetical protein [Sulfurisphaera tokodaii]
MKSYEVVSFLVLINSAIVYYYTKNIEYLITGIFLSLAILLGIKFIFEKFVA